MNDTRALPTSATSPDSHGPAGTPIDVRAYVARVRAALSDLPADDLDELTQGMEADLAELAEESGNIRARLGTPESYANELRAAAGMPPRVSGRRDPLAPMLEQWHRMRATILAKPWMRDARTAGWVVRGVVLAWVIANILGGFQLRNNLWLWVAGAWLSFWVGRRTLGIQGGPRVILTAVNLFAVLAGILAVAPDQFNRQSAPTEYVQVQAPVDGLNIDGTPVTRLTVYDVAGRQVDHPRVFDQNGNLLIPVPEPDIFTPPATITPLPQASTETPSPSTTTAPPPPAHSSKPSSATPASSTPAP